MSFVVEGDRIHAVVSRDEEGYARVIVSGLPPSEAQELADEIADIVREVSDLPTDELAQELRRVLAMDGYECDVVKVKSDNVDTIILACKV